MKNRVLITLSRIALVFVLIVGVGICLWWYPFSISLTTVGVVSGESGSSVPVDSNQLLAFWTQLIFAWLVSVPCFAVVFFLLKSTSFARHDCFFSYRNANFYKIVSIIIFSDSIILITGHMIFMFLKWNPFAILYYVIGILGLILALFSFFIYRYLEKATRLKEDNDSIL